MATDERPMTLAERRVHVDALGIDIAAAHDAQALKRAYRSAIMRWHPDKSGDATTSDRFQAARTAHKLLVADNELRESRRRSTPLGARYGDYTQFAHEFVYVPGHRGGAAAAASDAAAAAAADASFDRAPKRTYEEAFAAYDRHLGANVFSHSYARTNAAASQPLIDAQTGRTVDIVVYELLTLRQAAAGCTRRVTYRRQAPCAACTTRTHTACSVCRATRYCIVACAQDVAVPPGVAEGERLAVSGASHECARARRRGDLVVQIGVRAEHECRVHRHRDYAPSAKHTLPETFARLTKKLREATAADRRQRAQAAPAAAAARRIAWHVGGDAVRTTKLLRWTLDAAYDVPVVTQARPRPSYGDDDYGAPQAPPPPPPPGRHRRLCYKRVGRHVVLTKYIGVQQAIGAFSFATCDLADASLLVVVHKSPRRVVTPGTVLCVPGAGFAACGGSGERGHLFVRLVIDDVRELGTGARRRHWNSLLALDAAERRSCADRAPADAALADAPFVRSCDTVVLVDNRANTSYRVHTVRKSY